MVQAWWLPKLVPLGYQKWTLYRIERNINKVCLNSNSFAFIFAVSNLNSFIFQYFIYYIFASLPFIAKVLPILKINSLQLLKTGSLQGLIVIFIDVSRTIPGFNDNIITYLSPPLALNRIRVNGLNLLYFNTEDHQPNSEFFTTLGYTRGLYHHEIS